MDNTLSLGRAGHLPPYQCVSVAVSRIGHILQTSFKRQRSRLCSNETQPFHGKHYIVMTYTAYRNTQICINLYSLKYSAVQNILLTAFLIFFLVSLHKTEATHLCPPIKDSEWHQKKLKKFTSGNPHRHAETVTTVAITCHATSILSDVCSQIKHSTVIVLR